MERTYIVELFHILTGTGSAHPYSARCRCQQCLIVANTFIFGNCDQLFESVRFAHHIAGQFVAGTFEYGRTALQFDFQILRIQMINDVGYHVLGDDCQLEIGLQEAKQRNSIDHDSHLIRLIPYFRRTLLTRAHYGDDEIDVHAFQQPRHQWHQSRLSHMFFIFSRFGQRAQGSGASACRIDLFDLVSSQLVSCRQ